MFLIFKTNLHIIIMKSSYLNNLNYGDIFKTILFMINPTSIVEIGILDGFSLKTMADNTSKNCVIKAYDIFDEFNGHSADKEALQKEFLKNDNVTIEYGDFYKLCDDIQDNSIDLLHIDIANNGDVFEYVIKNYMKKIKRNGIIILEGGSNERDNVEWMNIYNKPKIQPIIEKYSSSVNIKVIGKIPSLSIITLKNNM